MKIQQFSISELGKFTGILGVAVFLALSPKAKADPIDLYDFAINANGTVTGDWQDLATTDPTTIIDAGSSISNDTNCCGNFPSPPTSGLGTVNYTFTGGAVGTYNVSLYYDYDVSDPNFNEYGVINNAGSAQSGVVGEIVNGSLLSNNILLFPACGSANCEVYGNANGTNQVPGTTSNFFANCGSQAQNVAGQQNSQGPGCNSDVEMALTFTFTTTFAGQQVTISALSGTSDPGGFSLETIHPIDTNNASASQVFLSGSYTMQSPPPPPSGTPEPATWLMAGCALVVFGVSRRNWRKA